MELVPANNNLNLDDIDPETKKAENELSKQQKIFKALIAVFVINALVFTLWLVWAWKNFDLYFLII